MVAIVRVCVCFSDALDFRLDHSYTKPRGQIPDYNAPVVMRRGATTVEDFCNRIHKTLISQFK